MMMTPPNFLILLSGALRPTQRLAGQIADARTIAADSGMRHATALDIVPELWVGDFDSSDASLLAEWKDVERQSFPAAKNATDGELAVEAALSRGARSIVLAGALGGDRSDHVMAHLLYATALHEAGTGVMLTSGDEEVWPLAEGTHRFDLPVNSLFSILCLTEVKALTIDGARYPLDGFAASFGTTRTISNVVEDTLTISHTGGRALLLARPYDFSGV